MKRHIEKNQIARPTRESTVALINDFFENLRNDL